MQRKLAQCPFCRSGEDSLRDWHDSEINAHMIWCATCGADGPVASTPDEADLRWNTRTALRWNRQLNEQRDLNELRALKEGK